MPKRRQVAIVFAAGLLGLAALGLAGPALAIHSVPSPHIFMDFNNNGVADASDSLVPFNKRGGGWTTGATSRVTEALAAWSANTDFNPFLTSTPAIQDIWLDGTQPANATGDSCATDQDTWAELGQGNVTAVYAVNCLLVENHPTYRRIVNSDIFLNSVNIPMNWSTSNDGTAHARGILTHEIGHSVYLIDLPSNACGSNPNKYTMCGTVTALYTWQIYSLETDDVNAANAVYP